MDKKDYGEIARIINNLRKDKGQYMSDIWNSALDSVTIQQADYFEKEDKENQPTKDVWDRKQFLKDCNTHL